MLAVQSFEISQARAHGVNHLHVARVLLSGGAVSRDVLVDGFHKLSAQVAQGAGLCGGHSLPTEARVNAGINAALDVVQRAHIGQLGQLQNFRTAVGEFAGRFVNLGQRKAAGVFPAQLGSRRLSVCNASRFGKKLLELGVL